MRSLGKTLSTPVAMKTLAKFILGMVTIVGVGSSPLRAQEPDSRHNVLFIVIDDLNDWISILGHPTVQTPNFERLAKRSVTFENAYCPAPVCVPSRTSFLTGMHPSKSGAYFNNQRFFPSKFPIGMDLYPNILSYLKAPLKPKEHLDGVDIMPLLTGGGTIKDRPLYWHYPHYDETTPYSSAIVAGWKVVRYADDGKVEVYNLNKDPMEKKDLATTMPEKTRSLVKSLDAYLTEVDAQLALPTPIMTRTNFQAASAITRRG